VDSVSFHCYAGNFQNQADFTQAYPDKEVYMTECTGTIGSDFWADIKWFTNTLYVPPSCSSCTSC
jgi:O-glycosyl hydrolase